MGKRTSYAPGTFSWVELATTDGAAAKSFYGALFGWESDDAGDGSTSWRLDGDPVCGLAETAGGIGAPPRRVPSTTACSAGGRRSSTPSPVARSSCSRTTGRR